MNPTSKELKAMHFEKDFKIYFDVQQDYEKYDEDFKQEC